MRLDVDDWHGSFLVESFAFGSVESWVEVTEHLGDVTGLTWAEELTGPSHLSASPVDGGWSGGGFMVDACREIWFWWRIPETNEIPVYGGASLGAFGWRGTRVFRYHPSSLHGIPILLLSTLECLREPKPSIRRTIPVGGWMMRTLGFLVAGSFIQYG